jgi:hypothetical protein
MEEEVHGSASAAAAAAQAAKAASAAAVRASHHLLGFSLADSPEPQGKQEQPPGFEGEQPGHYLQFPQSLHMADPDVGSLRGLGDAFATPMGAAAAAAAEPAAGSNGALRQRWDMWRRRYQQQDGQYNGVGSTAADDGLGVDQAGAGGQGGGLELQEPRWVGQPAWALAGVSGYR